MTVTDTHLPDANTFLIDAAELFADGRGDDDGLCESAESCVFAPHFGAYSGGRRSVFRHCLLAGDPVTAVDLYGFLVDGI